MMSVDRIYYRRNLLISLIISETLIILTFVLFPHSYDERIEPIINEQIIISDVIPPTRQTVINIVRPQRPTIPRISEDIDAFELLEDVKIIATALTANELNESKDKNIQRSLLNTAPRLSLEVLPDNKEGELSGRVNLSIKISKKGKVIGHKILLNSLECENCLDKVISAVYSSQWEPAVKNGITAEYWVQKSYVFN